MERKIYPVSQVNRYVNAILRQDRILSGIWLTGELSNCSMSRGHLYFTIKDAEGAISCVMFASYAKDLTMRMTEGMAVNAFGEIGLYEKTGRYQLNVRQMEPVGEGALYQAYLQLKSKLEREGLFDQERKREIPPFIRTLGIITAPGKAAVQDMIQISRRRFPGLQIIFCPVQVQGVYAAASIAEGIRRMNADGRAEVLLVGRGGGSIEDLWAFNEEETVRAIAGSRIPVISAVGHETDFTLADFAADLRAPTPSAAAELAVPDVRVLLQRLMDEDQRIRSLMHGKLDQARSALSLYQETMSPRMLRLHLEQAIQRVASEQDTMERLVKDRVRELRTMLTQYVSDLKLMDPYRPLQRGYSILTFEDKIVHSIQEVHEEDKIQARLMDGMLTVQVKERNPGDGRQV
ncbi:MAG: exodeoxyribonuclease VII large subunit [Clostridiales bacterium]|nr:exodeoxyribonuclease VII large subunit [Clostridiales bacterium]